MQICIGFYRVINMFPYLCDMKKSVIWIIGIVVGASFLVLLYLQMQYVSAMVKLRTDQFDLSVNQSLDQASRELEREETKKYLREVLAVHPELNLVTIDDTLARNSVLQSFGRSNHFFTNDYDLQNDSLRSQLLSAYANEQEVLDEVICSVLYSASEKGLSERLNVQFLDAVLSKALRSNGVDIPFHYVVLTSDGREIYRCSDYEPEGEDYSYTQTLFRNDPVEKRGMVRVHFPAMNTYIMGVARMMTPAIVFTLVLFVTFMYTVYLVFRQKKVSEMKNDFINNMTHEFKTPISSISLAAQMLADKSVPKSDSTYERLAGVIVTETKRLRFQVEKVLQMSLYDRNNIAFKLTELDANDVIDMVVKTFSLKVSQNGGEIQTRLNASNPYISADEMHFTNVIFNLMDNAVKYKKDDVDLQLVVSTWNQGDSLCICVQDNGIGIQRDNLKRIFEKFYRVHTGNQHNVKGFGLGLAYVHKMVALHHGTIKAESELGRGTKFTITLPNIKE